MVKNTSYKLDIQEKEVNPCEQKLLDIEQQFNINITVKDFMGLLRFSDGSHFFHNRGMHLHPYCLAERFKTKNYNKNCNAHCNDHMNQVLDEYSSPLYHICWKGVCEVGIPFLKNGSLCFSFYAGAYSNKDYPISYKEISQNIIRIHDTLEEFNYKKARELSRSLESAGQYILNFIENVQETNGEEGRKVIINRFILQHAHTSISLKDLGDALYLSSSRTSHLVQEIFGKSFKEILIEERVRRAKVLLSTTRLNLSNISIQVGFKTEYYLSRMFKKNVGISPGRFRKKYGSKFLD